MENLVNLKLLLLGGNRINKIDNIQNLQKLEVLSLENNFIEKVENIYGMPNLKEVKLQENKISITDEQFIVTQILQLGVAISVENQKTGMAALLPRCLG